MPETKRTKLAAARANKLLTLRTNHTLDLINEGFAFEVLPRSGRQKRHTVVTFRAKEDRYALALQRACRRLVLTVIRRSGNSAAAKMRKPPELKSVHTRILHDAMERNDTRFTSSEEVLHLGNGFI
jgi:hypothetical protein